MLLALTLTNEEILLWLVQALFGLALWLGKLWLTTKLQQIEEKFVGAARERSELRGELNEFQRNVDRRREVVDKSIEDKTQNLWKAHTDLRVEVEGIRAEHNMQMKLFPRRKWLGGEEG